ncbi:MAG: hypothetical protein WD355_05575 [Balneolaceae bacterium]
MASTVAAGVPLWTATGSIDFTSLPFLGLWLFIGVVVSFTMLFFMTLKGNDMIAAFTVGYMLAVITYFVGNILVNQNVYLNLSLALLIAALTGLLAGWSGAAIWKLIKRLSK